MCLSSQEATVGVVASSQRHVGSLCWSWLVVCPAFHLAWLISRSFCPCLPPELGCSGPVAAGGCCKLLAVVVAVVVTVEFLERASL